MKPTLRTLFLLFLLSISLVACFKKASTEQTSENKADTVLQIAFYNVENLFDIVDDPKTEDNEFLPDSKKKWNAERYQKKLDHLYKVLAGIGKGKVPSIIGVSEVENEQVLKDLIQKTPIADNYGVVHYDSPDVRGIDVGFLYDDDVFTPISHENLPVHFDFEPETKTRDVLYIKGKLQGEETHFLVNHWSSRRGGLKASEPKRLACATVVRQKLDAIFAKDKDAKIVVMGDFNDEPTNNSIIQVLKAKSNAKSIADNELFSSTFPLKEAGKGTYNYKGNWNMLDQIIISGSWLNDKEGWHTTDSSAYIFKEDWMLYNDKKKGPVPSRTYGGPNYYGGYSDHLPVYLEIKR